MVGDEDQSIYRFRGPRPAPSWTSSTGSRGEDDRPPPQLPIREPILDAAHRLVRFNDPDRLEVQQGIVKRLIAARRGGPPATPVRHLAFGTGSEEADWVAADIAARMAAGASPRDHAVLVRANADADPVLRSLNLAGVPWRFSGASGLYARPEIRLLLSFLRAVGDPGSSVDVYGLAASDVYGLGGDDLAALARNFGWPIAEVRTIEAYRGVPTRYSFPTRAEFLSTARAAGFGATATIVPGYELGERCPSLLLRPCG